MRIRGTIRFIAAVTALCSICVISGCTANSVLGNVKPETNSAELTPSGSGRLGILRYVSSKSYPTVSDSAFEFSEKIKRGSVEDFGLIMHTDDISVYYYYGELRDDIAASSENNGYYAIDFYDHSSGRRTALVERENIAGGGEVNLCSVLMSKSDGYLSSIACLDMAKMGDHVAAVFMNNDENSDDSGKPRSLRWSLISARTLPRSA